MANPVIINPTLTQAGQAAAFNAAGTGLELTLTHVSFGTAHYDPKGTEVALKSPVGNKVPVAGASRPTPYQIRMTSAWRENVGQVPVGEIGWWAGDVLVFVWSKQDGTVASYKTDGVTYVLFNDLSFASVPANSISFVVDPNESVALAALAAHEGASNAHPQYALRAKFPDYQGHLWGNVGGSANAITLTLPAIVELTEYILGQRFSFKATASNTGAATININGVGAKPVLKTGGVAVTAGSIIAGGVYDVYYDGTAFQLTAGAGFASSEATTAEVTGTTATSSTNWVSVRRLLESQALRAPLLSPALTGTPTAPTAAKGTNNTQIATTAFVAAALAALVDSSPAALDTLKELATALGNDPNFATTMATQLGLKAPLASPALSGNPTVPNQADGDNDTSIANTAFVQRALALYGIGPSAANVSDANAINAGGLYNLATVGNGGVNGPSQIGTVGWYIFHLNTGTSAIQIAGPATSVTANRTRLFHRQQFGSGWTDWKEFADTDSPSFTGTPTAPTAAVGTNTDQVATMKALVQAMLAGGIGNLDYQPGWPNTSINNCLNVGAGAYRTVASNTDLPPGLNTSSTVQFFLRLSTASSIQATQVVQGPGYAKTFVRYANGGTPENPLWSAWQELASVDQINQLISAVGWGVSLAPALNGVDANRISGSFMISNTDATDSGLPLSVGHVILHLAGGTATSGHSQFATPVTSVAANKNRVWHRQMWSGTWSAWQEFAYTDSPALSGTPTAPTAPVGTNTDQIATMKALLAGLAANGLGTSAQPAITDLDDVSLTSGFYKFPNTANAIPLASTSGMLLHQTYGTGYAAQMVITVQQANATLYNRVFTRTLNSGTWGPWQEQARVDSPSFTGTPSAPTPASGNNSTQIATTGFVQDAIAPKAPLASPAFTGSPTAPTQASGNNSTRLATTAFVQAALSALVASAPGTLDTLKELADALGNDPNFATTLASQLALKAPLASPDFTGMPTAPNGADGDSTTRIATTSFVHKTLGFAGWGPDGQARANLGAGVDLNTLRTPGSYGQTLNNNATLALNYPVATAGTLLVQSASTTITTQVYIQYNSGRMWVRSFYNTWSAWSEVAFLDSPTFTGTPSAPSAAAGNSSTQLANTAFVQDAIGGATATSVAGSGTTTLTAAQAGVGTVVLTGVLTGNKNVVLPTVKGRWTIVNNTTGAYTLTVKYASGTGIVVTQGTSSMLWGDGVNVMLSQTDFNSPAMTGTPTAPTPVPFTGDKKVVNAEFVQTRGVQYSSITQRNQAGTLAGVIGHIGGIIHFWGNFIMGYTLPNSATLNVPIGAVVRVQNWSLNTVSLGVQGSDKIQASGNAGTGNLVSLPPDTYVDARYYGQNIWILDGTGVDSLKMPWTRYDSQTGGYEKKPNGLIEQWGSIVLPPYVSAASIDTTFPIGFSLYCLNLSATIGISTQDFDVSDIRTARQELSVSIPTKSGFEGQAFMDNLLFHSRYVQWRAFGY